MNRIGINVPSCSELLAFCVVARAGRGTRSLSATPHHYACSALAGASGAGRPGACLSRSLQVLPCRDRRVFLPSGTLCGAKRLAGRSGPFRRGVALVQPLAPSSRFGGATGLAQSLAGTATAELEIAGQSAAARRRGRSDPTLPSARPALRQPDLGGEHRESVGAGVHPPRAPPAAKGPAVRNCRNISEPVPLSSSRFLPRGVNSTSRR